MWSTFERGPGRGFGVNNLNPPHTLANEEDETVRGGAALLLGSIRLALGVAHPFWNATPRQACPTGLGTPLYPQSRAGISRLAQLREAVSSRV
jgi:hypothetical protein